MPCFGYVAEVALPFFSDETLRFFLLLYGIPT
jgi:hypothetical protein